MADFLLELQDMFAAPLAAAGALPTAVKLALVFAPVLPALASRHAAAIASVLVLDLTCLIVLASADGVRTSVPVALLAYAASFVVAFFGLHARTRMRELAELEGRVAHMDEQITAFLQALERRSDMLDRRVDEASGAYREAKQALEQGGPAQPPPRSGVRAGFMPALGNARPTTAGGGVQTPSDADALPTGSGGGPPVPSRS